MRSSVGVSRPCQVVRRHATLGARGRQRPREGRLARERERRRASDPYVGNVASISYVPREEEVSPSAERLEGCAVDSSKLESPRERWEEEKGVYYSRMIRRQLGMAIAVVPVVAVGMVPPTQPPWAAGNTPLTALGPPFS